MPFVRLGLAARQLLAGIAPVSDSHTRLLPAIMWSQVAPEIGTDSTAAARAGQSGWARPRAV